MIEKPIKKYKRKGNSFFYRIDFNSKDLMDLDIDGDNDFNEETRECNESTIILKKSEYEAPNLYNLDLKEKDKKITKLNQTTDDLKAQIITKNDKISELESKYDNLLSNQNNIKKDDTSKDIKIAASGEKIESLQTQLENLKDLKNEDKNEYKEQILKLENQLENLKKDNKSLENKLQNRIDNLNQEILNDTKISQAIISSHQSIITKYESDIENHNKKVDNQGFFARHFGNNEKIELIDKAQYKLSERDFDKKVYELSEKNE